MEQKRDRKIFKRLGAIVCALALTIVAFMLPYSTKFNAKNMIASADEVTTSYKFVASDLYNIDYYTAGSGSSYSLYPCLFSSNIYYESGSNSVILTPFFNFCTINGSSLTYTSCHIFSSGVAVSDFEVTRGSNFGLYFAQYVSGVNAGNYFYIDGHCDSDFNSNVYKVSLYLSNSAFTPNASSIGKFLIISYYDQEDDALSFAFNVPSNYMFNTRTYYININFTDSQIYNQGFQDGKAAQQDNIYNEGYSAGQTIGYNNGYSAGIEAANNYSFFSLVSAVIDAPIQAFMGLFNFELLGVNLAGFFTGLLTLAFIITIVRLVMP